MAKTVGVNLSARILSGLVIDHELAGPLTSFPAESSPAPTDDDDGGGGDEYALVEMPTEGLVQTICEQVRAVVGEAKDISAVGVSLPGLIKNGVVEEAPNLPQLKGARMGELVCNALKSIDLDVPVTILNDADGVAAGLASNRGKLDSIIRVWTLGVGIGFGRYPFSPGVWEGGHSVVSLDNKEHFCGCGGWGHLEGIMGHRAMRLRFLDMEPEEVFEAARAGDARCLEFKHLWHKALAAASATSVHMSGPGKFFITGFNVRFVDLAMLNECAKEMVKMSPLQGYSFEIVPDAPDTRVIGAAVAAEQAAARC